MQPPQKNSWINLAELKDELTGKLGRGRSKQYFDYLKMFLSLKLSKVEFNKLCLRTVGRDNISLHNQLIRSILKNACTRKAHDHHSTTFGNNKSSNEVYNENGYIPSVTQASSPLALRNGDILPPSPQKVGGTEACERSSLGSNGRTNDASPSSPILQLENSNSSSPDARKPVMQQAENGFDVSGNCPAKFTATEIPPDSLTESLGRKSGKEISARTSLDAPHGIPYFPVSVGGDCKASSLASNSKYVGMLDTNGLVETIRLREHMEQLAAIQGLEGVSMDCASVLNNGLDAYLKGLIQSFAELSEARSGHEPMKHHARLNGVTSDHHYQIQSRSWPLEAMQEHEAKHPIYLLDFTVAMELNPLQLGEDWPVLLEKICTQAFYE